jgi:hypothetical protein
MPQGSALSVRIDNSRFVGPAVMIGASCNDGTPFQVQTTAGVSMQDSAIVGDRGFVTWDPSDAWLLPEERT